LSGRVPFSLFFIMLFTDSYLITLDQMSALDGEVLSVGSTSKADPDAAIRNAWSECAQFLLARLQSYSGQLSAGFYGNTVAISTYGNANYPRARLSNVVATSWDYALSQSPIESWLLYSALYLFYRDASTRKVKDDRLSAKASVYLSEKKAAWSRIEANGVPIVINPIAAPGAIHEPGSGTWDATKVTITGVAGIPVISYDVAVTWVGNGGLQSNTTNFESGPSERAVVQFSPGQTLTASIASLVPPTGNYGARTGYASGITTGQAALGWNLYVGFSGQMLTRQNTSVIPLTTSAVALTNLFTGAPFMGNGQFPTQNMPFARQISRF